MIIERQFQINEILDTWNRNKFGLLSLHLSSGKMGAWLELDILYRFTGVYMPLKNWRQIENSGKKEIAKSQKSTNDTN